jgi:hypothetical protein
MMYDITTCWPVEVHSTPCSSPTCSSTFNYDGTADCVFQFSDDTFFTFQLMHSFDASMQHTPRSFTAFVHDTQSVYGKQTPAVDFVQKQKFVDAWWKWNELRDLQADSAFTCPKCAQLPPEATCWILDCTAHALRINSLPTFPAIPRDNTELKGW